MREVGKDAFNRDVSDFEERKLLLSPTLQRGNVQFKNLFT